MNKVSHSATDTVQAPRLGIVRFGLGSAQMCVAVFAAVLLVLSGVNRWSLLAATLASVLTMISVLLFRKH
jgi:hypothetical protein